MTYPGRSRSRIIKVAQTSFSRPSARLRRSKDVPRLNGGCKSPAWSGSAPKSPTWMCLLGNLQNLFRCLNNPGFLLKLAYRAPGDWIYILAWLGSTQRRNMELPQFGPPPAMAKIEVGWTVNVLARWCFCEILFGHLELITFVLIYWEELFVFYEIWADLIHKDKQEWPCKKKSLYLCPHYWHVQGQGQTFIKEKQGHHSFGGIRKWVKNIPVLCIMPLLSMRPMGG